MLCENCNINEATVHFTEIHNGIQTEHHLCSECAADIEIPGYSYSINSNFPFVQLLTGLLAAGGLAAVQRDTPLQHVCCPNCGMSFEEFTRVGKFGCAECYDVFGPLIDDNMKCIHGDNVHRGKTYHQRELDAKKHTENMAEEQSTAGDLNLNQLQIRLKEAIELENFEEAARYRDEIKALKEGNNKNA